MIRKITAGTEKAFNDFLLSSMITSGGNMNNFAWEKYHEFIKYAHRYRVRLGDDDVREMLLKSGVRKEIADELARVYLHCRNVLYQRRSWEKNNLYAWLNTRKEKDKLIEEYKEQINKA